MFVPPSLAPVSLTTQLGMKSRRLQLILLSLNKTHLGLVVASHPMTGKWPVPHQLYQYMKKRDPQEEGTP